MFVPKWRLTISTSRSGGPGGQHVNRTESKVEIRFNVAEADWIPEQVRLRFTRLFANRITQDGEFVMTCEENRSRHRNQEVALERLSQMLDEAVVIPKSRRPTRPTRASKHRRLDAKSARSKIKKDRNHRSDD